MLEPGGDESDHATILNAADKGTCLIPGKGRTIGNTKRLTFPVG
jgi:hypothetical protein